MNASIIFRVVQQVLDDIRNNDLTKSLEKLHQWRTTTCQGNYHSLYRYVDFGFVTN